MKLQINITPHDVLVKTRGTSKEKITVPFICETDPVALALTRAGLRDVVVTGLAFWHTINNLRVQVDLPKPLRELCTAYDTDQFQEIRLGQYMIDLGKPYIYEY